MRFSASLSFMFQELPLLERFAAARKAGFEGVEIQRLAEGDPGDMARAARDAGVEVVLVNVGLADYSSGGPGLSGVPGLERAFSEALEQALAAAALLRARHVHLGPSRVPEGVTRDECLDVYRANARFALGMSRAMGASLLVEAMNPVDAPTGLVTDVATAAALVRSVGSARFGLQFDVYHVAMGGADPVAAFEQVQGLVRHVQFSDVPGRHEPGSGRLDIPSILETIAGRGYAGWFGAEYKPTASTDASLGWLAPMRTRSAA